jgi:cytosine/adenosine deaminase-related metal-dependent hydrolase
MLLTADWVVPVSRRPISSGGVVAHGPHVAAIGSAEELAARFPDDERIDLPGCVLVPGLVNAHTHLGLSAVEGLFEPTPFTEWLPRIVRAMRSWDAEDYAASTAVGAARCLEAGVTAVGDIAYGALSVDAAARIGLGGSFFFEVLGITPAQLPDRLTALGFVPEQACGPRIRRGLSPHTLYSSGPALLDAIVGIAREVDAPVALHVAETVAEVELVRDGSGDLAPVAAKLADGFRPTGEHPVAYLDRLGVLDGATAIHVCQTWPSDVGRLASTVRGVVTCPRSNDWLHNGIAPVEQLLRAGVPVGIGTDSLASTPDLDLFEEARALRDRFPALSDRTLIEMLTIHGAIALGVEDRFGALEPGMQADIAAFALPESDDPEASLVQRGGRHTLTAVLAGGEWVIRNGRPLADLSADEAAAADARKRAEQALA